MKKWIAVILMSAFSAGLVSAEDGNVPWYKKMFGAGGETSDQVMPPPPESPAPEMPRMQRPEGKGDWKTQMDPERREKMKAHHDEVMKLGAAIRNETDPAKKEALTAQLRAKVTEMVDQMLADQAKRLEQAEKEMPKLRERLADAQKNKDTRIEEHVQQIISGEKPKGPGGDEPRFEKFRKERKNGDVPPPPAAE